MSVLTPLRVGRSGSRRVNVTVLALVSIAISTLVAVESVPIAVEAVGALFVPSAIIAFGVLLPVAAQLRRNLLSILRVENALMIGIIYWLLLDMLQSAYPFEDTTADDVKMAYASVGLFAFAIWLGASGRGWRLPTIIERVSTRQIDNRTIFIAIGLAFALGMSKFVIACNFDVSVMLASVGKDRWNAPWARGDFGGFDAIFEHAQYFGFILPSLCVVLAMRVGWLDARVVIGILLSLIVIVFLAQSGGRRIIGVVVGAAVFTWVASRPRLSPTIILGGGLVLAALLTFMQEMLRYRNVGFGAWWDGETPELFVEHLHVDDNFLRLTQLINFFPEKMDYVYHQALFHALMLPVPRFLWPGKPTGPGFDLPALLGKQGVSLSSSIIGELWVSFGLIAVVAGGWLLGRIGGMWNKILLLPTGTGRALMYGLGLMALFAGMRSVQALVQMSYIVLAWIAIVAMLPKPSTRPPAAASP
jgi:hypothetical protein